MNLLTLLATILAFLLASPIGADEYDFTRDSKIYDSSGQRYDVGRTRTHMCKARWICGKARSVETITIYGANGVKYIRIYKNKKGEVVRIVIDD